ncbi:UPF0175 family protein [Anaerolineales bacterium HSG6]|nr:UPF0175 family protein [Anaerolineales bacterium HSG6]MDM8530232.1 UPF0175 family protein [Anaerolineales bacterium HSG25]
MLITPQALVQAKLYPDEQTVIQEALQVLWQERPHIRLDWAIYQYQTTDISLAKAAWLAGVSFDRLKQLLIQRGIRPRLGVETLAELEEDVQVIEQSLVGVSP